MSGTDSVTEARAAAAADKPQIFRAAATPIDNAVVISRLSTLGTVAFAGVTGPTYEVTIVDILNGTSHLTLSFLHQVLMEEHVYESYPMIASAAIDPTSFKGSFLGAV